MNKGRRGRLPDPKTQRLHVMLSDREFQQCQKAAEILQTSMAEVLRDGLRRTVKNMKRSGQWEPED